MSPVWGHVAGVITTLLMLVFVGIWIWAWRARHQRVFARMAQLPMEDETMEGETDANATATQEDRP